MVALAMFRALTSYLSTVCRDGYTGMSLQVMKRSSKMRAEASCAAFFVCMCVLLPMFQVSYRYEHKLPV